MYNFYYINFRSYKNLYSNIKLKQKNESNNK